MTTVWCWSITSTVTAVSWRMLRTIWSKLKPPWRNVKTVRPESKQSETSICTTIEFHSFLTSTLIKIHIFFIALNIYSESFKFRIGNRKFSSKCDKVVTGRSVSSVVSADLVRKTFLSNVKRGAVSPNCCVRKSYTDAWLHRRLQR